MQKLRFDMPIILVHTDASSVGSKEVKKSMLRLATTTAAPHHVGLGPGIRKK